MVEYALAYDLEADDVRALFEDVRRGRRHRAWQDASDIRVVSS